MTVKTAPVVLTECPRDAMQGLSDFIPTELKIKYLKILLKIGFDVIDFGSFVSPKAIPQMADTAEVLKGIEKEAGQSVSKLLAIVANEKGMLQAAEQELVYFLGFPFSVSETFQLRNTKQTIIQAWDEVKKLKEITLKAKKTPVIYLSMGFGNPYGNEWSIAILEEFAEKMIAEGIEHISLADTLGNASPEDIKKVYASLVPRFPNISFGAHFHASPSGRLPKTEAAFEGGCRRFDSAILGFGGCPYADDELVGNLATEDLLAFLTQKNVLPELNPNAWTEALALAPEVFKH